MALVPVTDPVVGRACVLANGSGSHCVPFPDSLSEARGTPRRCEWGESQGHIGSGVPLA